MNAFSSIAKWLRYLLLAMMLAGVVFSSLPAKAVFADGGTGEDQSASNERLKARIEARFQQTRENLDRSKELLDQVVFVRREAERSINHEMHQGFDVTVFDRAMIYLERMETYAMNSRQAGYDMLSDPAAFTQAGEVVDLAIAGRNEYMARVYYWRANDGIAFAFGNLRSAFLWHKRFVNKLVDVPTIPKIKVL